MNDQTWRSWIPQNQHDLDGPQPWQFSRVEITRQEWETPQQVDPLGLHPMMNVADLLWRPC